MATIAYSSPFIPPEWIAAHGLRPVRVGLELACAGASAPMGACAFAHGMQQQSLAASNADVVVFTTTCDQMRRAAEQFERNHPQQAFLFNMPATWAATGARQMYADELHRLGRMMSRLGGQSPQPQALADIMLRYDERRRTIRAAARSCNARNMAEAIAEFGRTGEVPELPFTAEADGDQRKAIALVGGPVDGAHLYLYDLIEAAGGRVVLDATETALRGLPGPFDRKRLHENPFDELVMTYFTSIPDIFRRPNTPLHDYLADQLPRSEAAGVLLLRWVWCDLWHAELGHLRQTLKMPIVEIDLGGGAADRERNCTRIESLVGILP